MEDWSESSIENESTKDVAQDTKDKKKAKDKCVPLEKKQHDIDSIIIETLERMLCDTHKAYSYVEKHVKKRIMS